MKSKLLFAALLLTVLTFAQASLPVDVWSQPSDESCTPAESNARYTVTFDAAWSNETHPNSAFPNNPHFSGLIGATHSKPDIVWAPGDTATPGIENMAETGGKSPLNSEIESYIANGDASNLLSGGGIGRSPGNVSLAFDISTAHPLVSLVSMIAPSPDWFVGVYNLSLCEDNTWVKGRVVELLPWDSGTDSGSAYTSQNANTNPQEPIALIEDIPFLVDGEVPPIGTFTFTLESVEAGSASVESAIASLIDNDPSNAANASQIVGDREMLQAIMLWATSAVVPGTQQTIDDRTIRTLIDKWVLRESVTA